MQSHAEHMVGQASVMTHCQTNHSHCQTNHSHCMPCVCVCMCVFVWLSFFENCSQK